MGRTRSIAAGMTIFCFVGVIFLSGLTIGVKFFHVHNIGDMDDSPWREYTKTLRGNSPGEEVIRQPSDLFPERAAGAEDGSVFAPPETPQNSGSDPARQAQATPSPVVPSTPLSDERTDAPPSPPVSTQPEQGAVAPPAAPAAVASRVGTLLKGGSFVELPETFDGAALTIGAWIKLNGVNRAMTMKTIVSNRWAGCAADPGRNGFAMYVNDWGTSNQQLRLAYSNPNTGCAALASAAGAVPYDEWTHVAVALPPAGSPGSIALFINGREVARETDTRLQQTTEKLRVGLHTDGEAQFDGEIADLTVWRGALSAAELDGLRSAAPSDASGALAAFPLRQLSATAKSEEASVGGGTARFFANHEQASPAPKQAPGVSQSVAGGGIPPPQMDRESDRMGIPFQDIAAGTWDHTKVSQADIEADDVEGRKRAEAVKEAMQHAWRAYRDKAWGFDEVKPRSGVGQNNWAGMAVTMVDSLDTLWIMGLKEEFQEARDWIAQNLSFDKSATVSVFETNIRVLGGLLSAYDLSKDPMFLEKARDIGDRLLRAFDTPSGIPHASVHLMSGQSSNPGWTGGSVLAELGTLQVEFRYLSRHTGDPKYREKADHVHALLSGAATTDGLYPIFIRAQDGALASNKVTFGALGDSFYEYLLKGWIQGGKSESVLRNMYTSAMDGVARRLVKRSSPSNLLYLADLEGERTVDKMDHLACFTAGMLALGARHMPDSATKDRDMQTAKALTYTCYQMYRRQPSGLSPEFVQFSPGADMTVPPGAPFYILRPETVESFFVLQQQTKHPIFRLWGWHVFEAINKQCRTELAFGAYPDVRQAGREPDDRMESFFLAETLKYLYLLFSPDHSISLDKYVFNTEAHPLTVFGEDGKPAWTPSTGLV